MPFTTVEIWTIRVDGKKVVVKEDYRQNCRLKQGGSRYFRELLQRIRDICSSERNIYQQVATCTTRLTLLEIRDIM